MHICKSCLDDRGMGTRIMMTHGPCEFCGVTADCADLSPTIIKDMDAEAMLFKVAEHIEAAKKIMNRIELPCGKVFNEGMDVKCCIEKADGYLQELIYELGKKNPRPGYICRGDL